MPVSARTRERRYLRVQDLRRLRHVVFESRRYIEGHLSGRRTSRQRGRSTEFNEHRAYAPGDEVRDLDWKVYGRSDRLFIKLYERESDMTVKLLVDGSGSMGYSGLAGDEGLSKYDQGCFLAAAIAFLTLRQRDRVCFGVARKGLAELVQPSSSMHRLERVLDVMEAIQPFGEASLAESIKTMTRTVRRRGLLVVFSDLLDDRDAILAALADYTSRGSEAILFHILHTDEFELPAVDSGVFVDSETDARIRLHVSDVRRAYQAKFKQFMTSWRGSTRRAGIDYNVVSTDQHYFAALERYLLRRSARRR